MAKYYGVVRSEEYLAHYGIKGMRWGVQKAKYKGNDRALARHYAKAQKKIKKYKDRMNVDKQEEAYNYHHGKFMRSALGTFGTGAVGLGGLLGSQAMYNNRVPSGFVNVFTHDGKTGKTVRKLQATYGPSTSANVLGGIGLAGAAAEIGLAAKSGYHAGKAAAAQYRSTKSGHMKTVRKYAPKVRQWETEVDRAFAGTKYGKKRRK